MPPTPPPEIRAELAAEIDRRQLAWLGLSPPVAGFDLRPLTVSAWADLTAFRNFYVIEYLAGARAREFLDGLPDRAETIAILWRLSPDYRRARVGGWFSRARWALDRLKRRILRLSPAAYAATVGEIRALVRGQFQDRPPVDTLRNPSLVRPVAPGIVESLVHRFGLKYGWPPAVVLELPLAAAFSLVRADYIARGEDWLDSSAASIGAWFDSLPVDPPQRHVDD